VELRQGIPRDFATIKRELVDQLGAVAPQKLQFLEPHCAQEGTQPHASQLRVAQQPSRVVHEMIEEHGVRFGYRVVAQPAELEWSVRARMAKVHRVPQLVQKGAVVLL